MAVEVGVHLVAEIKKVKREVAEEIKDVIKGFFHTDYQGLRESVEDKCNEIIKENTDV